MSPHPQFDSVVHEPTRLKICTTLTPLPELEFGRLQHLLALTAPTLSKHLRVLSESGYVTLDKRTREGRVHTWVSLTSAGREALCGHVSEIQRMARIVRETERRGVRSAGWGRSDEGASTRPERSATERDQEAERRSPRITA